LGVKGRTDVGPGTQAVLEAGTGSGQRRFRRLTPASPTTAPWPPLSGHCGFVAGAFQISE